MKVKVALLRLVYLGGGILMLGVPARINASEVYVMRTNLTQRSITNEIEIRMPMNVFVNEYHTNWIEQRRTNQVDVFTTNQVVVEAVRTNFVKGYQTNWANLTRTNNIRVDAFHTNFVAAYETNWKTLVLTNQVAVDLFETNFFTQYRTNAKTLFLTNWESVLIMKTNWVFQPVTNVVQIDLITNRFTAGEVPAARRSEANEKTASLEPVSPASLSNELIIEATATGRTFTNHLEVQLRASWGSDSGATVKVQRWRVEREDGAFLSFGQEAVFKRLLQPGRYKIEVRGQKEASGPLLAARGILVVTTRDATMQQHFAARQ